MSSLISFSLLLSALLASAASGATVESVVADIAKKHNAAPFQSDGITVSSVAEAQGTQVTFRNVLRVKQGLTTQQLTAFRQGLIEEVVRPACTVNKESFGLAKGLSYRFIYDNTYGERLAMLVVNDDVCKGKQKP